MDHELFEGSRRRQKLLRAQRRQFPGSQIGTESRQEHDSLRNQTIGQEDHRDSDQGRERHRLPRPRWHSLRPALEASDRLRKSKSHCGAELRQKKQQAGERLVADRRPAAVVLEPLEV